MEGLNIDVILIIDEKSGLELFMQYSSRREIDTAKIAGFLHAFKNLKAIDGSATLELEHEDSIFVMTEFATLQTFLVMKESPPSPFLDFIEELSNSIYKNYGDLIKNFNGDVSSLKGIKYLVNHHLNKYYFYHTNKKLTEKVLKRVERQLEKEAKRREKREHCPICGSLSTKKVEDKSKVLSYISIVPIYAKKYICMKCGFEY